jgi:hypothetical protein
MHRPGTHRRARPGPSAATFIDSRPEARTIDCVMLTSSSTADSPLPDAGPRAPELLQSALVQKHRPCHHGDGAVARLTVALTASGQHGGR